MPYTINNQISLYPKVWDIESKETIPLDIFLDNIRTGKWQDLVLAVRIAHGEEREALKKKAPSVTVSGVFTTRKDDALDKHSGYINIDIDNVEDPEELKSLLCVDKYIAAAFVSIGGRGLCLLFRIDPAKHREAFAGISEYLLTNYSVIVDPTSVNPSRARFVSYDPHIYLNESADKFTKYVKEKQPKKIDKAVFAQDDFEQILKEISQRQINITQDSYFTWLQICFSIVWKFGESGRTYFHIISQYSSKYKPNLADKQFDACVKHKGATKEITISTFYYYAKLAGINIYSERTKIITYTTQHGKKGGLNEEQIADNLENFEGITNAEDIIAQVYRQDIDLGEDTLLDQLELWMRQNYSLERNEITRYIENSGQMMTQADLNSIFIRAKKIFEKVSYELIDRLINSHFVPTYNPFKRYFAALDENADEKLIVDLKNGPHLHPKDIIKVLQEHFPLTSRLFSCIRSVDADYTLYFGAKWLVGTVSAVYGRHSPLMFVLSGSEQNTGKTEFFRRLLPLELHDPNRSYPDYYSESKLDSGKDDEILMCQKFIIMDDEMGGKSKKEVKRLKELTSKQTFSLREPYGRNNVDLQRIAVLCGTTNENEILSDPTGNRRIIPIHVYSIDNETYNSIDKADLWKEVYSLYRCGLRWRFTKEDIQYLGQDAGEFEVTVAEAELIQKFFEIGEDPLTATEIKVELERTTNQKLSLDRIGKDLKRMGFKQEVVKSNGIAKRVYFVRQKSVSGKISYNVPAREEDDLPF